MRKILSLFILAILCITGATAQVLVQGQSHPTAKRIPGNTKSQLKSDQNFTFDDVKFWVGTGSNRAALVIEWHDGTSPDALVWGYRWDGEASGHDMIVAIAKADPKLLLLTQYTGWMGYTIDGIGYGDAPDIRYDLNGAKNEPHNAFKFEPPITNPLLGQTGFPEDPAGDIAKAIREGQQTGVIYHPINTQKYGYPSYDYDYWTCASGSIHWKAGWYNGYWSYFVKSSQSGTFSYSGLGATSRMLVDGSWDAWSWNGDMGTAEGTSPGDSFVAAPDTRDNPGDDPDEPDVPVIHVTGVKITPAILRLQIGTEGILTPAISPVNADNKTISWISSDPDIATVKEGVVTGVKSGMAKITVKTTDGGYTAVCEVTVTEKVTPEIKFEGTTALLSFPKVEEATSYEVCIYKYENGNYTKTATYVADAAGNIVAELGTKSLLPSTGIITIPLKNMDDKSDYAIEIQVMKGLDVIDTYRVERNSGSVDNDKVTTPGRRIYYTNATLHIENMEDFQLQLFSISGKQLKNFTVATANEAYPLSLPTGLYIVAGENNKEKVSFKIQVIH